MKKSEKNRSYQLKKEERSMPHAPRNYATTILNMCRAPHCYQCTSTLHLGTP